MRMVKKVLGHGVLVGLSLKVRLGHVYAKPLGEGLI